MNSSSSLIVICAIFFITTLIIRPSTVDASLDNQSSWIQKNSTCESSIAECLQLSTEFQMDSEINRRILAANNHISYDALKRNSVPCSQRGSSYYNCKAGAQANPYTRGCNAITHCRSSHGE